MENLICGLTQTEVDALKKKHGHIFLVTVTDGEEQFTAICKEPNMSCISASLEIGKTDELKGSMVLFDNCVVKLDDAIESRDLLKMQVIKAIGSKIEQLKVATKNL